MGKQARHRLMRRMVRAMHANSVPRFELPELGPDPELEVTRVDETRPVIDVPPGFYVGMSVTGPPEAFGPPDPPDMPPSLPCVVTAVDAARGVITVSNIEGHSVFDEAQTFTAEQLADLVR